MEFWEGETEHDGKNRARHVTEKDRQKRWYFPVLAGANDDIQITTELIAL